ncbi:MAG: adenosylcobinamide amidohydrolase, partial [Actinocatenispora sp.]
MDPRLAHRTEAGYPVPVLVWRFDHPRIAICSGPLGGGIGVRDWLLNATVPLDYARRDPDVHLTEIAAALDLPGTGAGLLTAVDVTRHAVSVDGGVGATATVGLSSPAWAAAPDGHFRRELPARHGRPTGFDDYQLVEYRPGTINIAVAVPVRLGPAALVNAVVTATEAKSQALAELGVAATGTASDAVCVHCPADGTAEPYAGPRSTWGARLARAVHAAVLAGTRNWL